MASRLSSFDYYDKSEFKPGGLDLAVDPGGYSAPKQADSFNLMLDYIASMGADACSSTGRPANGTQPTAAEMRDWTESQFLAWGADLLRQRRPAESVEVFQTGFARYRDSAQLQTGLGISLFARGEHDAAVLALLRATDLAPADPRPYLVLAQAYLGATRVGSDKVPERLARLTALDPRNPQAHYYYALTLGKEPSTDGSVLTLIREQFQTALELDPNFADAHLQLGILYATLAQYPDAIREYQSTVRLRPGSSAAHYRLAQAYARTGEQAAAKNEIEIYERLRNRPIEVKAKTGGFDASPGER
jgi:tetratricopeptide (TPR) repeat protein